MGLFEFTVFGAGFFIIMLILFVTIGLFFLPDFYGRAYLGALLVACFATIIGAAFLRKFFRPK